MSDMSDATKKVLKQQLGSVLTSEKPKPSPKYTPTQVVDTDRYYSDDSWGSTWGGTDYTGDYGGSFGTGSYYDSPDEEYAQQLIEKMEMNPSEIQRVVDQESVTTLVEVITLLLYR